MRKLIALTVIAALFATLCGCKTENEYLSHVSELRQDIYVGSTNGYTLTAYYGFQEKPFVNDGKCGALIYGYTIKLNIIADETQRKIEINNDGEILNGIFKCDENTGEYKAFIETEKHFDKTFSANLICGAESTPVTLNSILPEDCLSYADTLNILSTSQTSLLESYKTGEEFNAEIYMRVFVKNENPYWFVGIASGNNLLKAFLTDGKTGEVLAIREII